ncbi:MAG TPA: DUF4252 domain-containing protein [Methylomirabilota bacterium]|nr:DUF4252 domain-containing protein [Methylomirabilota bacterium]
MKKALKFTAILCLGLCAAITLSFAADPGPGYVDFGKLQSSKEGEFVDVNIRWPIIAMASKIVETKEPEIGKVLGGLKHIRVNVIGMADDNRDAILKSIGKLRQSLGGEGWENIVTVKEQDQDVSVSLKLSGKEAIEGLVVTVVEGNKKAVLVNIVGDIRPEQIAMLGEKFNIDPLKNMDKVGGSKESKE